jgi:hydrogenase maturation protein HypF
VSRSCFLVTGIVQGVGFRPFVYKAAKKSGLKGMVKNTGAGVIVEVEGPGDMIVLLKKDIKNNNPPASEVNSIKEIETTDKSFTNFTIVKSSGSPGATLNIPPDIAICDECRNDISNLDDRRYDYPFTTCLNCGPRFSILKELPYDRKSITMDDFKMCGFCRRQYNNIKNRRYHAQPIACPECGPKYSFKGKSGIQAIKSAAKYLAGGGALALKGWGGYHLIGDAESKETVRTIRELKKREYKPLALMADSISDIKKYCRVSSADEELLKSFRRPIVLLEKRSKNKVTEAAAPQNMAVGFMLPYSAVHYMLFKYSLLKVIVATSLNRAGEPTIINRCDASDYGDIPKLEHNLKISLRSDDSVIKSIPEENIMLRRSRGYVPRQIPLPGSLDCLTSGAGQNSSFCFAREGKAMPSQYTGNLNKIKATGDYKEMIEKFKTIWGFKPVALGCDMHPGYGSSRVFKQLSNEWGLDLKKIQHHHAHLAGCAAENKLKGDFIGVAFDGMGYGPGGEIMGGEFMKFNYHKYSRRGYLKPRRQPGGNTAAKEPWRMAVSYLKGSGVDIKKTDLSVNPRNLTALNKMIEKGINSPFTTSAGRLFDAVAAMAGIVSHNTYIARAPIALESLVRKRYLNSSYDFDIIDKEKSFVIDTDGIIRGVARDIRQKAGPEKIASKFHYTIAAIAVAGLEKLKEETGLDRACLSGGVFCNYYLTPLIKELIKDKEIKIYTHRLVSPGDNGISYGQAAVLSGKDSGTKSEKSREQSQEKTLEQSRKRNREV